MAEMTGAQAMYEMMVRHGVKYVFGNPGTTELPLMDMFAARNEIEYVLALHEDSALGIAAGYADATGKAAVVNLHTNPGLAHGLGNLYNAFRAGTPLVVTAGQQDTRSMLDEPLLFGDMIEMASQYTKWSWEVRTAAEIPAAMARAFTIAETPPTGPVFLSLPVNLMEERAEMQLPPVVKVRARVSGDQQAIEEAAALLASSRNPAIIAGDGAARSGAIPAIIELAELLGARVHSEPLNALLDFPTGHALYGGPLFANSKQVLAQLEGVDTLLLIGVTNLVPLVYTGTRMIPDGVSLIQIDVNSRELGRNYPVDVAIVSDALMAARDLAAKLSTRLSTDLAEALSKRRELVKSRIAEGRARFAQAAEPPSEGAAMSPAYVAAVLRRMAAADAVLIDESVTSTAFVRTMFELAEPNSFFYAKGGSLGLGLPASVGVKLAKPDRQVICTVGDGTLLYTLQALWTAAHLRLGVKFVVFNNSSYMILKGGLLAMQGASVERGVFTGMEITEPEVDFVKVAESMGVPARRASTPGELKAALEWSLAGDQPALVDVAIQREARSVLR